jgi:hypothetical protein
MNALARLRNAPFPDEMMVVRVPMSRTLYARLLAECVMCNRSPDIMMRDLLTCAFESGDLSPLFDSTSQSVASASPQEQKHERK